MEAPSSVALVYIEIRNERSVCRDSRNPAQVSKRRSKQLSPVNHGEAAAAGPLHVMTHATSINPALPIIRKIPIIPIA